MKNTVEHFIAWVTTLDGGFASQEERLTVLKFAGLFIQMELEELEKEE